MLIKYEFLKILRKKSTLIVMAVSLILTAFLFGLPIMQYQTYNQDGVIKGAEGIACEKEQYSELSVPLTEEYITETILNTPSRELSDEQKEYWSSMASKVDTPLQYGYYEGWEIIMSSFELLMFAILAICIVIAPVFSGEYQAGTDAVILSGKYGKTKLITAKIVSSLLFAILAFTLHVVVACGLPLAAFGANGWNLPVQIANTTIPYPFTFLQATLLSIGIIYLILLAMIGLTLLLSSKMKTPYLVLIVLVPILFIPMFLTPNGTTGAYNLTLFLLPYRATMPEIGKYISYQFGGLVLDAFSVRAILYAILTVIMLPLARLGFKKHQVA